MLTAELSPTPCPHARAPQLGATPDDYVSAVQQTILAGGDSGSRGLFVGAVQAARVGDAVTAIPSDWIAKTAAWGEVSPLVAALVAKRPYTAA